MSISLKFNHYFFLSCLHILDQGLQQTMNPAKTFNGAKVLLTEFSLKRASSMTI